MKKIFIFMYIVFGMGLGCSIAYILFKNSMKYKIQKYKNNCELFKQKLHTVLQDFENESILRKNIKQELHSKSQLLCELHNKLSSNEEKLKLLNNYYQKYEQINNKFQEQLSINHKQELELKALQVRFEEYKLSATEKNKLLSDNENKLTIQFENLANRIFDQNRYKINEQNRLTLDSVLHPFREQLNIFKNQIQDNFCKEEKIIHTLAYEIHNLHKLNNKITQETINLTQALKGNNKTQGNWGEVILTKALEASGMREGHEFHTQVNIKGTDGKILQPDVIIHLPNGKNIIIDSKISLTAYERYFNSDDKNRKHEAINDHIHSLRNHIKSLNKKNYQESIKLNTLDYILMFIPIESAFTVAISKESSLLTEAMHNNIMLVSPTTLLIALKTINNLWQYERQNFYSKKIAEKAGKLYDKLRLFMDDLNKIEQFLNKTQLIFNSAKNKFSEGKGNIISQVENFREFGVQIKRPIVSNSTPTNTTLIITNQTDNSFNSKL